MNKEQTKEKIIQLVSQYSELDYQTTAFQPGKITVPPSGKVIGAKELQLMVEASLIIAYRAN